MKIEYGIFICNQSAYNFYRAIKAGKRLFKVSHFKGNVRYKLGESVEQVLNGYSEGWEAKESSLRYYLKTISFRRVYLTKTERKEKKTYYYKTIGGE